MSVVSTASSIGTSAAELAEPLEVRVVTRESAADGVVALTLESTGATRLPEWSPGAHVDLVLAPDLVRQYSLCGDPLDRDRWRIAVLLEPAGRGGSRWIHDRLDVGASVTVRGPRNHFPLARAPRYLFIAGGIGITPLLPMIARAHAEGADWRLAYGGRTPGSMAFVEELRRYGSRVGLYPQSLTGPLDLDAILREAGDDTPVYCCGPEGLLAAVEQRCALRPGSTLHVERFAAAPRDPSNAAADHPFTVRFRASGVTAQVPPGRSIVDVAEEAGVAVSASCLDGVCGTCETAVLHGAPDHRDSVLDQRERASGRTMMICVSRSADQELHLDL